MSRLASPRSQQPSLEQPLLAHRSRKMALLPASRRTTPGQPARAMHGKFLAMATLASTLLLAACGSAPPANIGVTAVTSSAALPYTWERWTATQDSCEQQPKARAQADSRPCGGLTVELPRYATQPALNQAVERSLLELVDSGSDQPKVFPSLRSLRETFIHSATPGDVLVLKAKPYRETPALLVIERQGEEYSGGANGLYQREFLNWSLTQQRALALDDVLEHDQRSRFDVLLRAAYDGWLKQKNMSPAEQADYEKTWPYLQSNIFALSEEGLTIVYPLYAIAPRSDGLPTFVIPYAALNGILRPEYLPHKQ